MCKSAKSLQSCLILCDPMDCRLPGSSVHGVSQVRTLEGLAVPSSGGIFLTQESSLCLFCLVHWQAGSLPLAPPGKPLKLHASEQISRPSAVCVCVCVCVCLCLCMCVCVSQMVADFCNPPSTLKSSLQSVLVAYGCCYTLPQCGCLIGFPLWLSGE